MKVVASTKLARAERAMRSGKAYGGANQGTSESPSPHTRAPR